MEKHMNKQHNIAILGIGTVGGGTYDILTREAAMLKKTQGLDITVKYVLDKCKDIIVKRGVPQAAAVDSLDVILADESVNLVVETMGGVEPAKTFILKILQSGRSVVSANKELIAKHGKELEEVAKKSGAGFYYEASVAGGIPIIRVLQEGMQANNLVEVMGIINGTTNYILTKMAEQGLAYADVLKEAQSLGFAESDPTADVDAFDSMYKLSILSSMAFHVPVSHTQIYREGITSITAEDIVNAKLLGYVIKLLAIGKRSCEGVEVRVHPCFVPLSHPLASVRNEFNAVFLKGDSVDDIMLYGRGAGAFPTASAIVSDVISALKGGTSKTDVFSGSDKVNIIDDFASSYYMAITAVDKAGVLAKITEVFSKFNVSISQMVQRGAAGEKAQLVFLTHPAKEHSMQAALSEIKKLKEVKSSDSLIRVL